MIKVFMGGTCNGSKWREDLKSIEGIDWFDPVAPDWNEEAKLNEMQHRQSDDYLLYVLTPRMVGFYSIAELVDDSNKAPKRVVFSFLKEDDDAEFNKHDLKSLHAIAQMVINNGGTYIPYSELNSWFSSLG